VLEVQGKNENVALFMRMISDQAPPLANITTIVDEQIQPNGDASFTILPSVDGPVDIQVAPDSALCRDCLEELFNPADRRYHYPFITCTNCGPRYTIITGTPYDRPNTTMAAFPLCPDCRKEYDDPGNRRFHAQPLACPACGPQLQLLDNAGHVSADRDAALDRAVELLKAGKILAIKGIGGYHLAVDACNNGAVKRLRERKKRDEKPFAVMAADIAAARTITCLSPMEERLLTSLESPIVIVRKASDCPISELVAPRNGWLGVMLPYTPVHHLLMQLGGFTALVMTSANTSDEPITFENEDALLRLSGISDYFLIHDRPIHTRCDDSVMRVFQGKPLFYRRSRGYVPRPITLPFAVGPILAVGAEMKSTIALANNSHVFLSQHIGDLQNDSVCDSFRHSIVQLSQLFHIAPATIACDRHPDYLSSIFAADSQLQTVTVQHHHAHMAACMAENGLDGDVIGLIYDGTGYGDDGTIWGGEILVGGYNAFYRAGHFRQVRLPGGEVAVREPWRMALAYLYMTYGESTLSLDHSIIKRLSRSEHDVFSAMLEKGINSPLTSSCGRLFDAVAALLNVRHTVSYDGQSAIELEALAEEASEDIPLPFVLALSQDRPFHIDFTPMFPIILSELQSGTSTATLARRFHKTVAQASHDACLKTAQASGLDRVVLSGGVFQNRLLTEMLYTGLTKSGLQVFTHRLVPPNDGCIALGQTAVAGWQTRRNN
jgi:hydrogenase maturation protein HypF